MKVKLTPEESKRRRAESQKAYYQKTKEVRKAAWRAYYQKTKEVRKAYIQQYSKDNKEKRQQYNREYLKDNTAAKLRCWIHNNVKRCNGTDKTWLNSVGCTKEEFKAHIESQFVEGMSWDNWTKDGWHIDHIIPLSRGGTNHYTNLQPLWAIDNLSKGNSSS